MSILIQRTHATALVVACLLAGCGDKAAKPESHEETKEPEVSGVTFKEGRGLKFLPETAVAIGLKTAPVEERAVPRSLPVTAQVLDPGPPALLSVTVAVSDADRLEKTAINDAKLVRIDRTTAATTGLADLTLSVDRSGLTAGEYVPLTLTDKEASPVVAVPKSAVLRSAAGVFVYAVSGDHLVRTPVKTGAENDAFVEITDGLYSGDIIVTTPVEQLWLIELRAVKGGAGCGC